MGKRALILSGGSIKGAFQAGAIKQVLDEGFEPDIIHGISVGSLNGCFMTNETGKRNNEFEWPEIGEYLTNFWIKSIKGPDSIIDKKSKFKLLKELVTNKFNGLTSTKPLRDLLGRIVSIENLRKSKIDFSAGAVNMVSGNIKYFNALDNDFIKAVIASTAIPLVMPLSDIGGTPYYDGGLRDVAPLKGVIEKGATEIVIILCQSENLSAKNFNPGNIMHLSVRVMEIIVNEIVNNDVHQMKSINKIITKGQEADCNTDAFDKKMIKFKIIRPQSELTMKIDNFSSKEIKEMIDLGQYTAKKAIWQY